MGSADGKRPLAGFSLEFIIIDDGSTDGTNVALANYARHDTRVRILHQENQGLSCPNQGL
jgi:glycosyltransferase involved in cell wall biosynthesis